MDPSIAKKKVKRRRAPPPPNPFTGEVEQPHPPVTDDEEEDVRWLFWRYNKIILNTAMVQRAVWQDHLAGPLCVRACVERMSVCLMLLYRMSV